MSLGPASDSSSARKRSTAVGVSLRAAARDRNLVPLSADFLAVAGGGDAGVDEDAASGMEAATSGFFAMSAATEGGVEVDGAVSVAEAVCADFAVRGSFCDRFEAGEEGDKVAHAGSMLEVEPGVVGGG